MAETDRAFITRIDDQFKKVSSKVDKISALIKGRDKSGIPIPSPLFNAIYNIEKNRTSLEAEVEDIKNVHPQNQPIDKDRKRKVDDELKMFKRNVMNMKEGLDFALDARSPSPFAWVVFSAGTAVLIGVLIYYISLHTNRPASARLQGISDEQRLNAIDAIASIRVRAALLEDSTVVFW